VSHGFFTVNYPQFVRCYEVRFRPSDHVNVLHADSPASCVRVGRLHVRFTSCEHACFVTSCKQLKGERRQD
jgi:hypothetical protein